MENDVGFDKENPDKDVKDVEDIPVKESQVKGVSIRGWIAITLTVSVCVNAALNPAIQTQMINGWLIALGFYFGQKTK